MKSNRLGEKLKDRRIFVVIASALILGVLSLVFVPATYTVHDRIRAPAFYGPHKVVRFGCSRIQDKTFVSYVDGSCGSETQGRCYIDYIQKGREVRKESWFLNSRTNASQTRVTIRIK
jgi:hypothetical protein